MEFRRRLYARGSSFETTIPMPILLALEQGKSYDVVFSHDPQTKEWRIRFEEREGDVRPRPARRRGAA